MQNAEHCVEFQNPAGQVLRGIFHCAEESKRKNLTLICLNTGLNDMAGWHRLQVKSARLLAENGYDVLRFDDIGIGDSDGEITDDSIVAIFADIQTGGFLENANLAVDFCSQKNPENKLVYLGFCGGGITGLLSAAENEKVSGLVCIGGPVTISADEYLHKMDPWAVNKNVTNYKEKIFDYKAWLRLLTFRGEYKTIFKSIFKYITNKISGEYSDGKNFSDLDCVKNLNKSFFYAFEKANKRKCPCLFFYADTDSAAWEFKKYFMEYYADKYFSNNSLNVFIEEPNSNHIFSDIESQKSLDSNIINWLTKMFPDASKAV